MSFAGFGLNYDASVVPSVLVPSVPFLTLSDGTVVPVESGLLGPAVGLDPACPAAYGAPRLPPGAAQQHAPAPAQRPLNGPGAQRRPGAVPKIRRPPNAFMVFANEHRKILAKAFPQENNQSISVRLGSMWKAMAADHKNVYYQVAKEAAAEHKRLYPSYVYSPKEARMRKQARELVRREKAVRPETDGPGTDPACDGDAPSTETRAKLMEVTHLLDSISSDRLLHQSGSPASVGSSLPPAETAAAGSPAGSASNRPGAPPLAGTGSRAHGPLGVPGHQEELLAVYSGAGRGRRYHTVLGPRYGGDVHWTALQHGQVGGGPVLQHGQVGGGAVLQHGQVGSGAVLQHGQPSPGSGADEPVHGCALHVPCGPAAPGGRPVCRVAARPAGLVGFDAGSPAAADGGAGACPLAGPALHWRAFPAAACSRSGGLIPHHLHGGGPEAACQPQLVSIAPAAWSASVPAVPPAQAAPAAAGRPRLPRSCLHQLLASGGCGHCCGTPPPVCQCHCPAVSDSPRQRLLGQPPPPGQCAMSSANPAQCVTVTTAHGPGILSPLPPERCRRPTAQLRVPGPRSLPGLRDPPAVDIRSCWRVSSVTSLGGTAPEGQRLSGYNLWDSPPPAAYLRSTHSPNIEELVGASANPLTI